MTNRKTEAPGLILPDRSGSAHVSQTAGGYICRALLALFLTLSQLVMICDSLDIAENAAPAVAAAFISTVIFALMGISKRFFFGVGIVGAGLGALLIFSQRKPLESLFMYCAAIANAYFRKLELCGAGGFRDYITNFDYSMRMLNLTENISRSRGFVLIAILLSAIFCACLLKRVHTLPITATVCALATALLYYGMPETNYGFAMLIASVCGITALASYDRFYTSRPVILESNDLVKGTRLARREYLRSLRTNSALGGYVGFGAAMLASLILLLPSGIKKNMEEIPAISTPALKLENFMVSLVNGNNPDLGSLLFSGVTSIDSRKTDSSRPRYTGEKLFRVGIDTQIPVYLRNWVGSDYAGDVWTTADYTEIDEYKALFGGGFSPELLTSELLYALDPRLVELPEGSGYKSHVEYGYVTARVDIRKLRPTANLVFLPSYTDQKTGLLDHFTRTPSSTNYKPYYDGLFVSTVYLFLDEYSVIAQLPLLRDPDFAQNLWELMQQYKCEASIVTELVKSMNAGVSEHDLSNLYTGLRNISDVIYGAPDNEEESLAYRWLFTMTDEERDRALGAITNVAAYKEHVYDNYLGMCENSQTFRNMAEIIVERYVREKYSENRSEATMLDDYSKTHETVMAIIEYLSKNMTYTLDPKEPSEDIEAIEPINAAFTFLFDTREGYCIHFATTAVMLLRAMGIPARYAEGYIADAFVRNQSRVEVVKEARYNATVVDSNAHAWIEVYFDDYGWIQYEATTPYMADMYEGSSPSQSTGSSLPVIDEPIPEETLDTSDTTLTTPIKKPVKLPVSAVLAALLASFVAVSVIILRTRNVNASKRSLALIADAKAASVTEGVAPEVRIDTAKKLNAQIFRILALCGLTPERGEQLPEFARRTDDLLGSAARPSFTRVAAVIQASEFSTTLGSEGLVQLSSYYKTLREHALTSGSRWRRFVRSYIIAI